MIENYHPDLHPDDRLQMLQNNADKTYKGHHYQRQLTEDELTEKREQFTQNSIVLGTLEDELDEIKEDYKIKMKPLKTDNTVLLQMLKTKQESKQDDLFEIFDHSEGNAITYNSLGEFVSLRRLRPDEKQGSLYSLSKTAND